MIGAKSVNNPRWQALAVRVERWKRLVLTTYRSGMRGVELVSAVILAGAWFVFLFAAGDTFNSAPTFATMARLGTENAWAIVAGFIAVLQAGGLACDHLRTRTLGTALAATYYATVAVAMWQANPLTPGWVVYVVLSWFDLLALYRMLR